MEIINFLNLKGGVAKTFSVVNTAYELWRRGYKVLILDNDKQGNLSKAYRRYDAEQTAPVTRLLCGNWERPEELIQCTDYDGIDIVPSNMSLFGAVWNLLKSGDSNLMDRYQRFMELVKNSGEKGTDSSTAGGYDYCLIDNVDYAKSERQFRVNGAAVPFPTAHQRRSLFIDFITLAHAYSVHSFQDGKNAFCQ